MRTYKARDKGEHEVGEPAFQSFASQDAALVSQHIFVRVTFALAQKPFTKFLLTVHNAETRLFIAFAGVDADETTWCLPISANASLLSIPTWFQRKWFGQRFTRNEEQCLKYAE